MQLCDQLTTATCLSTDLTGAGNNLLHRHHKSSLSTSKMFSSISWIHAAFTCVCLLISHLPLHRCQVLNGPLQGTSISVQEGEVATFSCEIDCSNDGLSWFVGIDDKTYAVGAFINHLKLIGIDAEMQVNDAACDAGEEGDSRNKTSMLTIVTSAMLDRAPVQCASSCLVSSCLCGGSNAIFRSPFAILRVESDTTPATEMPTVPPMPASSSSSAFPQPTSSSSVAMMAATPESRTSSSTTQQTLCQPTLDPTMKPGIPVVETEPISDGTATEASGINLKDAFTIGFPAGVSVGLIMGFLLAVLMFFCTSLSRRAKQMNGHSIELSMETCRETPKENVYVDGPSHTKSASAAAMPVPSISPSPAPAPAPHAQAQAPSQLARHPTALAAAPHTHPHPHPQAQTLPPPPQQQQQLLPPPSSATASYVSLTQI